MVIQLPSLFQPVATRNAWLLRCPHANSTCATCNDSILMSLCRIALALGQHLFGSLQIIGMGVAWLERLIWWRFVQPIRSTAILLEFTLRLGPKSRGTTTQIHFLVMSPWSLRVGKLQSACALKSVANVRQVTGPCTTISLHRMRVLIMIASTRSYLTYGTESLAMEAIGVAQGATQPPVRRASTPSAIFEPKPQKEHFLQLARH